VTENSDQAVVFGVVLVGHPGQRVELRVQSRTGTRIDYRSGSLLLCSMGLSGGEWDEACGDGVLSGGSEEGGPVHGLDTGDLGGDGGECAVLEIGDGPD